MSATTRRAAQVYRSDLVGGLLKRSKWMLIPTRQGNHIAAKSLSFFLPPSTRRMLLKETGVPNVEILKVIREVDKVKGQRRRTIIYQNMEHHQERLQRFSRWAGRVFLGRKSCQEQFGPWIQNVHYVAEAKISSDGSLRKRSSNSHSNTHDISSSPGGSGGETKRCQKKDRYQQSKINDSFTSDTTMSSVGSLSSLEDAV